MHQEEWRLGAFADSSRAAPLRPRGRVEQGCRECLYRGMTEKARDRCFDATLQKKTCHFDSQERVSPYFKEVVLSTDPFEVENFRPDPRHRELGLVYRRLIPPRHISTGIGRRQRLPIHLATGRQRPLAY